MGDNEIKRLIITGCRGVVATATINWLKKNHKEVDIVRLDFSPFHLSTLWDLLKDQNVDYFINCAGLSENSPSIDLPYIYYQNNAMGVLNQLEMIRQYSPKTRYCVPGSIYEHDTNINTPYVSSKRISNQFIEVYKKNYNLFCIQPWLGYTEYYNRKDSFISKKIVREIIKCYHEFRKSGDLIFPEMKDMDQKFIWTWAEDVSEAIWNELNADLPKNNFLDTGLRYSIKEFIEVGLYHLGIISTTDTKYDRLCYIKEVPKSWSIQPKVSFRKIVSNLVDFEMQKSL